MGKISENGTRTAALPYDKLPVHIRPKAPPFAVRLPSHELNYLRALGERDSRPVSYYVNLAVVQLISEHKKHPQRII